MKTQHNKCTFCLKELASSSSSAAAEAAAAVTAALQLSVKLAKLKKLNVHLCNRGLI